jgi:hypothetical protein
MPRITIEISEHQEAKMLDHIQKRRDFLIDGGSVFDGEKWVFLHSIVFRFFDSKQTERVEAAIVRESP